MTHIDLSKYRIEESLGIYTCQECGFSGLFYSGVISIRCPDCHTGLMEEE